MLALSVINHLLQQNPEIRARLQTHARRTLRITVPPWGLNALIDAQGFLQATEEAPQTTLCFYHSALQKLSQGQRPGVGDVGISGDQDWGMALLGVLGGLRYWFDDDVARMLGNGVAGGLRRVSGSLKRSAVEWQQDLAAYLDDCARADTAPVVHRLAFADFADAVDVLRDDAARLEARLRRLAPLNNSIPAAGR